MITTKKLQLNNKILFKIQLATSLKKYWWIFICLWIFALLFIVVNEIDSFQIFIIAFSIIYPISIILWLWKYSNSKDNKIFFMERHYDVDDNHIIGHLSDGTVSTIKVEHFIKKIILKESYLLYISKNQFIYFPKNSFNSKSDQEWFENNILNKVTR